MIELYLFLDTDCQAGNNSDAHSEVGVRTSVNSVGYANSCISLGSLKVISGVSRWRIVNYQGLHNSQLSIS